MDGGSSRFFSPGSSSSHCRNGFFLGEDAAIDSYGDLENEKFDFLRPVFPVEFPRSGEIRSSADRTEFEPFSVSIDPGIGFDVDRDLGVGGKPVGRDGSGWKSDDFGDHPADEFDHRCVIVVFGVGGVEALEFHLVEFLQAHVLVGLVLFPSEAFPDLPGADRRLAPAPLVEFFSQPEVGSGRRLRSKDEFDVVRRVLRAFLNPDVILVVGGCKPPVQGVDEGMKIGHSMACLGRFAVFHATDEFSSKATSPRGRRRKLHGPELTKSTDERISRQEVE